MRVGIDERNQNDVDAAAILGDEQEIVKDKDNWRDAIQEMRAGERKKFADAGERMIRAVRMFTELDKIFQVPKGKKAFVMEWVVKHCERAFDSICEGYIVHILPKLEKAK